jgi:hypothetical protein
MGSFGGHAVPGAFFVLYGTAWCINFLWFYIKTKSALKVSGEGRGKKEKPASSSFFEFKRDHDLSKKSWVPLTTTRVPIEPIIKIIAPMLGIIVEAFFDYGIKNGHKQLVMSVYSVRDSHGELNGMGKLHHITMYGGFVLSGVMDLLTLCVRMPRPTSMMFLTLAFLVEYVLFFLHTSGRDEFNIAVHTLLTYSILSCVVFSLLRIFNATNIVINLGLGSSILLQGTWFIQAGYFLYGGFISADESDDDESNDGSEDARHHRYVMFMAACYTWHLLFIALGNVVTWVILSAFLRSRVFHKRTSRRRGFLTGLQQGWKGVGGSEERHKLIVEEANDGTENGGIELQHMAEMHA